jgi:hypothetical protein
MTKLKPKRDIWAVRDADGLVHMAQVIRFFSDNVDGLITSLNVSTACHPAATMVGNPQNLTWTGHRLPRVDFHDPVTTPGTPIAAKLRFTVVDWNVREAPTCLMCIALGGLE